MPKYTYEEILQRMLDRVPEKYDKRESSVIFSALAPAAVELELMYIELKHYYEQMFADTASREFLIRRAVERGLSPYPASKAVFRVLAKPEMINIPIGSRFNYEEYNYRIIEKVKDGEYRAEAETPGGAFNAVRGDLTPIEYINGLERAWIEDILIPGEDEEDTEAFRERYFESFDVDPYGGNIRDYKEKTNKLAGIGATKVTPIWKGGGTVLLTILDGDFNKANPSLIKYAQEEIDPEPQGQGYGIAPIGHTVTVRTVDDVAINIKTKITFETNITYKSLENEIKEKIESYLLELRKEWSKVECLVVRIAQIETRILDIAGVLDVENTSLNGQTKNLQLDVYEVPVLGGIVNGV